MVSAFRAGSRSKKTSAYKIYLSVFGRVSCKDNSFFVTLIVFIKAKEQRRASEKFLKIVNNKFVIISSFIQFLNYANSLVDKFISCLGKLNPDRFELSSPEVYKGAFFITTHVGNVEILRSLFQSDKYPNPQRVNVFLQSNACEIFNNFLKTLEIKLNIDVFPVEQINPQVSILISERLKMAKLFLWQEIGYPRKMKTGHTLRIFSVKKPNFLLEL